MSEKMGCPACSAYSSSVWLAYWDDKPCPHCGLTADVAEQILSIRARKANEELTEKCAALMVELDAAKRSNKALIERLDQVADAMEGFGVID